MFGRRERRLVGQFVVESWLWGCGENVIRFLMHGGKEGWLY
jgi:hypothetical protein